MFKSIACGLAIAAALPVGSVAAQPTVQHKVVHFGDLDLTSPAGSAALERRLNAAARRVCGSGDSRGLSYVYSKAASDCRAAALAGARKAIALKTGAPVRKV